MITQKEYARQLNYIENYWKKLTFYLPEDKGTQIGLPHPFVSPSTDIFKGDQFYWDSYFTILGLLSSGKIELARGMVDNLVFLFRKYNIVPMRNRLYNLGISQLPFLTSMILEVYNVEKNKSWLRKVVPVAEQELLKYWMDANKTEKHLVHKGLSRYCDHHITDSTAEHESGWDMTSRFNADCLDYLPIDLNSCLYKYEVDLAGLYRTLKNRMKEKRYLKDAERRKKTINQLMWNKKEGFYFDYNYSKGKISDFYSLAGFYPLWAGFASKEQANKAKEALKFFEYSGGLANTQKHGLSEDFRQWDYPNGWANEQWIVVKSLLNYGFEEDAMRVAKKWLDLNSVLFKKTGKFWEKYNVVENEIGKVERYPNQTGFGWTNAIFVKMINELAK